MYSLQLSLPFTQPAHCSGSRPGTWAASNWCGAAAPRGTMENLEPIKVLGEGAFGKVYLMRHKVERALCCVKVKNIPKKEREACRMEVMQFCDGGDLSGQIKTAARNRKLFAESKILHWFVQMALGLHYMHAQRVLHRDLKTQNIFLTGNGRLVLGDLGISKEIFKNKPYSYKSDIWALGCVLYEMTTLNHAFDANSLNGLACKIIKGRYPPIASRYSKSLRDLVSGMLSTSPSSRPQLEAILRKPFVKKHIKVRRDARRAVAPSPPPRADFLTDIANRDAGKIGDGTMAVKAAALCVVTDPANAVAGMGADARAAHARAAGSADVSSLRSQLDSLQMGDVIAAAFEPPKRGDAPLNAAQAERAAREQAAALRREEDRRRSVETALAKLKKEREERLRDRERLRDEARKRAERHRKPPHRNGAARKPPGWGRRRRARTRTSAAPRPRSGAGRPDDGIPARRSGTTARASEPAHGARDRDRDRDPPAPALAAAAAGAQPRRRRAARARRIRRRDERRREVERELERERERERARAREQHVLDAIDVHPRHPAPRGDRDRRDSFEARDRDHRHDPAAAVDRARAAAREGAAARRTPRPRPTRPGDRRSAAVALAGPAESKPADRRPWDRAPAKAEAKPAFEAYDDAAPPPRRASSGRRAPAPAVAEPMEPRETGLSARERVLLRKQEAQAAKEAERVALLNEARAESQALREQAKAMHHGMYRSSLDPAVGAAPRTTRRSEAKLDSDDDDGDDDEGEQIGWAQPDPDKIEDAEDDIRSREEQLKAELELTTQRCEELRKTLHDTKKYIATRTGTVKLQSPTHAAPEAKLESARFAQPPPLDEEPDGAASWRSKVTEEDDDCLYEEDEEDDEDMVPVQTRLPAPQPAASASRPGPIAANLTPRGAEHELTDAPSPTGRLAARAPRPAILGPDKVHFSSLIDQLIFMEDSL
ncbi:serine/threonine kinase [Aureococcus anophagefferens]|nr:serine/threonine kinase [Aureococcus anophagefferens]